MQKFEECIRKNLIQKIYKINYFEKDGLKFAIVISGPLIYAVSLFCCHELVVKDNSYIMRAMRQSCRGISWHYDFKEEQNTQTTYYRVKEISCEYAFTYQSSEKIFESLQNNFPDYIHERISLDYNILREAGCDESTLELKVKKFYPNLSCKTCRIDYFLEKNYFDHLNTNEMTITSEKVKYVEVIHFECYDLKFFVVYARLFGYRARLFSATQNSVSWQWGTFSTNKEVNQLWVFKPDGSKYCVEAFTHFNIEGLLDPIIHKKWNNFDPKCFFEYFTITKEHKEKWNEISPEKYMKLFKIGSILRAKRKIGYYHAGVYLGQDLIFHVSLEKENALKSIESKIYKIERMENFIGNSTYIEEVRLPHNFEFGKILDEALKSSNDKSTYSLVDNNCEHFACKFTTGHNYSFQTSNGFMRVLAYLVGNGVKSSNNAS